MKSLDDPENPYRDGYTEYDKWVYSHLVTEQTYFANKEEMPEGWVLIGARTTSDNFLVPYKRRLELTHESLVCPGNNTSLEMVNRVYAEGIMTEHIKEVRRSVIGETKAKYFNRVPEWVLSANHEAYMLVPNGDIVAVDFHNDDKVTTSSLCGSCSDSETWFRYSSDGDLINISDRGWWWLYFDSDKYTVPQGSFTSRSDGYAYFENWETGEILSVWSWDGTPLENGGLPSDLDNLIPFLLVKPSTIDLIYEYQSK